MTYARCALLLSLLVGVLVGCAADEGVEPAIVAVVTPEEPSILPYRFSLVRQDVVGDQDGRATRGQIIAVDPDRMCSGGAIYLIDNWRPGSGLSSAIFHHDRQMQTAQAHLHIPTLRIQDHLVHDFDGDGVCDLALTYVTRDSLWLHVVSPVHSTLFRLLLTTGVDLDGDGTWDGGSDLIDLIDVDGDGSSELLIGCDVSYDLYPRQLVCVDLTEQSIRWRFDIANIVGQQLRVLTHPRTGEPVLIVPLQSKGNAAVTAIMADTASYVAALDADGELLWYRQVGAVFEPATTMYADWDGDGLEDVYIPRHLRLDPSHSDKACGSDVLILNAAGDVLDSVVIDTVELAVWTASGDLNNDGRPEFVHRLSDDRLQVFNERLERVRSVRLPTRISSPMPIHDVTGTGTRHLLVSTADRGLWLFDDRLSVVAYLENAPGAVVGWATPTDDKPGFSLILANRDRTELFLYELRPSGPVNFVLRHPWLTFFAITIPLTLSVILLLLSWRRTRRQNRVISNQRDALNDTIDRLTRTQARLVEAEKLTDALRALEVSEENFRNLAEHALQGILVYQDERIVFVNRAACSLLGRSEQTMTSMTIREFFQKVVAPEYRDMLMERFRARMAGDSEPAHYESRVITAAGESRWVEVYAARVMFHGNPAVHIALADITERKLAEMALRDREQHYRLLVNGVRALIGQVARDGTVEFVNEPGAATIGLPADQIIGRNIRELFPPESAENQMENLKRIMTTGKEELIHETLILQGELRRYLSVIRPVTDAAGRPRAILVIGTDVSDMYQTELALKEERDFVRSLLDTATSLIVTLDKDACITEFNPECERVTGYKREEVLGQHWPSLFLPEDMRREAPEDFVQWVRDNPRGIYEGRIVTRYGNERTMLWSISAIIPDDSDHLVALAVGQDITDRKAAEQALRESEERYRLLVHNVRAGIALVDREGQFLFINEVGAKAHGKPAEQLVGKTMHELFPHELANYQMQNVRTVIDTGREFKEEAPTKVGDQWRWYFTNVQPFRNGEGVITAAMVIAHDITDTMKAQTALKEERDFVRSLLDTANSLIVCLDSEARITVFNDECERVTGYRRDEVIGRRWPEVFLPDDAVHNGLEDFVAWVKAHPRDSYEGPLRVRSGEVRTILWSNSALISEDGKTVTALAVGQDITERKRAEQAVSDSEERLRHLAEATPVPMSITGFPEGDILYYNQPFLDLFGISAEQTSDVTVAYFYDDLADRRKLHETVSRDGGVRNYEIRGHNYNGQGFWVTISSHRTVYEGRDVLVTGYYDITERKHSEAALRYRVAFEQLVTSISTRFINIPPERLEPEIDRALDEIRTFTESDLVVVRLFDANQAGQRFAISVDETFRNRAAGKRAPITLSEHEWLRRMFLEQGSLRFDSREHARQIEPAAVRALEHLEVEAALVAPIMYRGRLIGSLGLAQMDTSRAWTDDEFTLIKIVAEILANVFEHRRFEHKLVKATQAKYDQVREIAGGVSHEIHNALFPALSGVEKLRQRLPESEDEQAKRNRALINLIDQSVSRAMSMTRLVTTLSRLDGEKRLERVSLRPLIGSVIQANQSAVNELGIDLTVEVPPELAWSCSSDHAFSVCNNLVRNAIDALADVERPRELAITASEDSEKVQMSIRDNGPGIPDEIRPRIFDAFFSTKPGTGSGLGLAVVRRILDLYGGGIEVRSELDTGTEFVIFCPKHEA